MRDLLKSAVHVLAMDAFANESTLNFLRQYRGENIRVFDNKYQPHKDKSVKILYDPDKGSEAIRKGLKMLEEDKQVAFSVTSFYFGQMDGKQHQEDFADINATWSALDCVVYTSTVEASISFEISNHFDAVIGISNINIAKAFVQMFYRVRDGPYYTISLYNSKKTGIFKEPNRNLIHAKLSALRPEDLPTAIKGHREWNKINNCYTLDSSLAVETYIEVEYQSHLSAKYFPEILCSLIASTGVTLELISTEDSEKVNRNKFSHTINNTEKRIKSSDAESIANASDISSNEAEILKQNPICSFANNITLQHYYLWRTHASGNIDFVKKYNNPEPLQHFRRLAYFRRQGSNATKAIENLKIKEKMQWEDSYESMDPPSVDLHKFYLVKQWEAVHNLVQSIGFRDIDDMNILSGDDMAKTFEQSRDKIIKIREDALLLFGFKTRAKGLPDLNATIKFINAVTGPILPPYKPELIDETQNLFDSIPITSNTTSECIEYIEHNISDSSNNVINKKDLFSEMLTQYNTEHRKNSSQDICHIDIATYKFNAYKKEIPDSLISLSSEFLIKNESDVDMLVFYLQQKFQMS
ncbi:helicase [Gigaspora margarita]|uniref:Helicase n=1 Tax=Gigaspora margarita TaxID=4874 RepID=A0A8H4AUS1_GIGMA|nr:helicase [Gigaspora margarita]